MGDKERRLLESSSVNYSTCKVGKSELIICHRYIDLKDKLDGK